VTIEVEANTVLNVTECSVKGRLEWNVSCKLLISDPFKK